MEVPIMMEDENRMASKFVKEVIEIPCVAQCIVEHIFKTDSTENLLWSEHYTELQDHLDDEACKTLFAFSVISKDERFCESISPTVHRARFRCFFRRWVNVFQVRAKSYYDQENVIWGRFFEPIVSYAVENLLEQRDEEFTIHMQKLCDFARKNRNFLLEENELKVVVFRKVEEMMDILPDFYDDGRAFLASFA